MTDEKKRLRKQMDHEMASIRFTSYQAVTIRTHPKSWKNRWTSFMNKEIEISLVMVMAVAIVFVGTIFAQGLFYEQESFENIEGSSFQKIGENYYTKEQLERIGLLNEN
ncbi:hypothetical protein AJ85_10715 [Alkalihalobacillus alcalophilus ATCC 27647 = CGMCC 1.3604]|uniref:Uncharacterized protein n=1 Tax=Alkalihalobacillus alcalophilus ATCC 27647 = CGMCC 1.3604 TaxID=1218173 RepID=A0A094XGS5_ALKAL|nr:hypothetical protein [Alkalihalobacillus alcalophilus]KGA97990.1 hypothetical protein BALCAV_0206835 [Alkalihalobacillus alcalophilus ATCC 27647 = CGMCC 1.3604]MED1561890.1 hypothetical protein [Alkalihalobacillus alcalophilus]THG90437.1 hypothetical protein AJ85_10715 [Alkalihalobacillus alcalophilus ATCC 27647 = CGMCC 1.3604]